MRLGGQAGAVGVLKGVLMESACLFLSLPGSKITKLMQMLESAKTRQGRGRS